LILSKKARVRSKLAPEAAKLTTVEAQRVLQKQGQSAQRNFLQDAASKLIEDNKRPKPAGKNPGYMLGKRALRSGAPPPLCETCSGRRELKLWCRIGSNAPVHCAHWRSATNFAAMLGKPPIRIFQSGINAKLER
jgi:hypothetical protein